MRFPRRSPSRPARLPRGRAPAASIVTATAAALALAACGGAEEDPQEILDQAFSTPIESADVTLDLEATAAGVEELSEPIRIQASGPYRENGGSPSFALDTAIEALGAQIPPVELISSGDRLFVEVQGTPYELGKVESSAQDDSGLAAMGLEPSGWVEDAQLEEDAEVAGVPTNHVSGSVDVPALLDDLNGVAGAAPGIGRQSAPTLSEEQAERLAEAVDTASFDVFAGEEDGKLRRLALGLSFEVPEENRAELGGASSGSLSLSLELANVDGDQRVPKPTGARPFEDLLEQIFAFDELLGGSLPDVSELLGEGGGRLGGGDSGQDRGGGGPGGSGGGGQPQARGLPPDALGGLEQFERYGECLLEADPADPADLERCDQLLEQ